MSSAKTGKLIWRGAWQRKCSFAALIAAPFRDVSFYLVCSRTGSSCLVASFVFSGFLSFFFKFQQEGQPLQVGESCNPAAEHSRDVGVIWSILINAVREAQGGFFFSLANRLSASMKSPFATLVRWLSAACPSAKFTWQCCYLNTRVTFLLLYVCVVTSAFAAGLRIPSEHKALSAWESTTLRVKLKSQLPLSYLVCHWASNSLPAEHKNVCFNLL